MEAPIILKETEAIQTQSSTVITNIMLADIRMASNISECSFICLSCDFGMSPISLVTVIHRARYQFFPHGKNKV